mmetsp:Transcript_89345/g.255885  ORF Transcript_89345/g.255885 Transcript_89345/m.255885 type:complete len:186 (-) Transcript_89345:120-677(-)
MQCLQELMQEARTCDSMTLNGGKMLYELFKEDDRFASKPRKFEGSDDTQGSTTAGSSTEISSDKASMPYIGSSGHSESTCKPCLFAHTAIGCEKGFFCVFCHYTHSRRHGPRPCKGKRDRYRKLIEARLQVASEGFDIEPEDDDDYEAEALPGPGVALEVLPPPPGLENQAPQRPPAPVVMRLSF